MSDFMTLAAERYSVRKFRDEPVAQEAIDKILRAGHLAPTGCNYQPQRIYVIRSAENMEKLRACTKCHFGAPTALLVCHNTAESWVRPYDGAMSSPVDAVIVATHMLLAARNEGVGCCWVMHFDPAAMRQTFAIPDGIEPAALLVMGYPAENAKPLPLHFKTRPITETVVYEHF